MAKQAIREAGKKLGDALNRRNMVLENCTIYCSHRNLGEVVRLVGCHFPEWPAPSPSEAWSSLVVCGKSSSMRLTSKWFRESGDDFCQLLLSTCAFVEALPRTAAEVQKAVVTHIESCELVLGVVVQPGFDSDERYNAVVFAIAKALDGLVFNGREVLNADGELMVESH